MTKNIKTEDKEKYKSNNEKLAKSRIKLGLLLNEFGEKNNLKVTDEEYALKFKNKLKACQDKKKWF